jgi:hypothetical protein
MSDVCNPPHSGCCVFASSWLSQQRLMPRRLRRPPFLNAHYSATKDDPSSPSPRMFSWPYRNATTMHLMRLNLSFLIFAVLLHSARAVPSWSPLSTLADSIEYQPLANQPHASVQEVLQAASQVSKQLRAQSTDDAAQPFARLRRHAHACCACSARVIPGQCGHRRRSVLRRVQHTYR